MKKRIVSLCLILAMMLCLFPVGVSAAGTDKQTWSHLTVAADGQTATGYCPHCCDDSSQTVTWNLLTRAASGHTNITASGHYFLNASTATNGALQPSTAGIDVVLHLNGQTFKRNGAGGNNTGAIRPQAENTTISIVDDQAEKGTVHGDYGWAVTNNSKSGTTVKLYSGNLTSVVEAVATSGSNLNGGTVYMNAGAFEMYGGTINGTKAQYGGAIFMSGSTVATIRGGTVNGGEAKIRGGAIYTGNANNVVNIYGGTVQNGICLGDYAEGGGNIYSKGAVNLYGGTITGGKSTKGGNLYVLNTTTLNGDAVLANGEATYGGNLYVDAALTLGAVSFENGTADFGSDIYVGTNANMTVDAAYNGVARVYYSLNHVPETVYGGNLATTKASDSSKNTNRCTGVFSGKLYLENDPGMPLIYGKSTSDWLWISNTASAALVDKNGNYTWYDNNDAALAAYNENTAYLKAGGVSMPLPDGGYGDYVVDIAGRDVVITGSGNLTVFDSANDDYETYGVATIIGPALKNTFKTTVAGRDTFMIEEDDNKYSFHTMGVDLIGVTVRPDSAGMYYTGMWQCDDRLAAYVDTFGVAVSLKNQPGADYATDGDTLYTQFEENEFESGVSKTGVIINNIMSSGNNQNGFRSRQKVYATAYVTFAGGAVTVDGDNVRHSLYNALELAEDYLYDLHQIGKADDMLDFYNTWTAAGVRWDVDLELTDDEKAILDAYSGKTAYHGEAHDHGATGGNSDGNYTLNQWKQSLEDQNMDFTTIVDHRQNSHMTGSDWDSTKFIGGTEASTNVQGDAYAELESSKMHYSVIFTDASKLDYVAKNTIVEWSIGSYVNYYSMYNYPDMDVSAIQKLIKAVQDNGGMFTIVHPKSAGYIKSDDPLMYYFADWTGLEVFYGAAGYAPTQAVNKENYQLWVDLLAAGKKVWATAGSDQHAGAGTNALTTIYSHSSSATDIFSYMKEGNSVCGPVGIRMTVGDTFMGSETDFAGKRLIFSVDDFHESVYDPDHTYSVKLISDQGVVYETEFDASKPFVYGMDADDSAKFYRVEVYDVTAGYELPIAIGNPIWNS